MIISKTNIQTIDAKISAYIGFAVRSNKVVYGVDNLTVYKKKIPLILVSSSLADSSLAKAREVATFKDCAIYQLEDGLLEGYTHRQGVKAIAILDTSLAGAISDCISSL